ncbi:MAG: hypothetical protein AAFP04_01340 [Myxococcota bacterium]
MARDSAADLLRRSVEHARRLPNATISFVTCGYDTGFESLRYQVHRKLVQLETFFGGRVEWTLTVVDDVPHKRDLSQRASEAAAQLGLEHRLRLLTYRGRRFADGRQKGEALRQGIAHTVDHLAPDALVYLNLNLKVHAGFAATGLHHVLVQRQPAAIGTRSPEEGGHVRGAGSLGRAKSRAFNLWVSAVLPPLAPFRDTNAPMKVFGRTALSLIRNRSSVEHITMDCEWLLLLHLEGLNPVRFPIVWTQRDGSRPPWHRVPASALDVLRMRLQIRSRS